MKCLIDMRKSIPELRNGDLQFVNSGYNRIVIYDKSSDSNVYRVILNVSNTDYKIDDIESGEVVYSRKLEGNVLRSGGAAVISRNAAL